MSYGLKCYTAGGYLSFDADQMDSFVRVIVSGHQYFSQGGASATIDAPGYDYVYTFCPASPSNRRSHRIDRLSNSFVITNLSVPTVIGYIAYKL